MDDSTLQRLQQALGEIPPEVLAKLERPSKLPEGEAPQDAEAAAGDLGSGSPFFAYLDELRARIEQLEQTPGAPSLPQTGGGLASETPPAPPPAAAPTQAAAGSAATPAVPSTVSKTETVAGTSATVATSPAAADGPPDRRESLSTLYERAARDAGLDYADIDEHFSGLQGLSKAELMELAHVVDVTPGSKDTKKAILEQMARSVKHRKSRAERTSYGSEDRGVGLPAFGQGGLVDKPTVALVGEQGPEAIVPLADLSAGEREAIEAKAQGKPEPGEIAGADPIDRLLEALGLPPIVGRFAELAEAWEGLGSLAGEQALPGGLPDRPEGMQAADSTPADVAHASETEPPADAASRLEESAPKKQPRDLAKEHAQAFDRMLEAFGLPAIVGRFQELGEAWQGVFGGSAEELEGGGLEQVLTAAEPSRRETTATRGESGELGPAAAAVAATPPSPTLPAGVQTPTQESGPPPGTNPPTTGQGPLKQGHSITKAAAELVDLAELPSAMPAEDLQAVAGEPAAGLQADGPAGSVPGEDLDAFAPPQLSAAAVASIGWPAIDLMPAAGGLDVPELPGVAGGDLVDVGLHPNQSPETAGPASSRAPVDGPPASGGGSAPWSPPQSPRPAWAQLGFGRLVDQLDVAGGLQDPVAGGSLWPASLGEPLGQTSFADPTRGNTRIDVDIPDVMPSADLAGVSPQLEGGKPHQAHAATAKTLLRQMAAAASQYRDTLGDVPGLDEGLQEILSDFPGPAGEASWENPGVGRGGGSSSIFQGVDDFQALGAEAFGEGGLAELVAAMRDLIAELKQAREREQQGQKPGIDAKGNFTPAGPQPLAGGGFGQPQLQPSSVPPARIGGPGPWMPGIARAMGS